MTLNEALQTYSAERDAELAREILAKFDAALSALAELEYGGVVPYRVSAVYLDAAQQATTNGLDALAGMWPALQNQMETES